MKFLKNLTACVSCTFLVLLVQSCGDDTVSPPSYGSNLSSVSEFPVSSSDVAPLSSDNPQSSGEVVAGSSSSLFEIMSSDGLSSAVSLSSSSVAELLSSITEVSSSAVSSATAVSSSTVPSLSSAVQSSSSEQPRSSSQTPSSSSAKPLQLDFFNGADISEVQEYERNN